MSDINSIRHLAEQGDVKAQYQMACFYIPISEQQIIEHNYIKGVAWLEKAAVGEIELGTDNAIYALIYVYGTAEYSSGASGDEALALLKKFAGLNVPRAMVELGRIYVGDQRSPFIKRFSELSAKFDPTEGLQLLDKVVECETSNLDFENYESIGNAYTPYERKAYSDGNLRESLSILEKQIICYEKALKSVDSFDPAPPEIRRAYEEMLRIHKGKKEETKKLFEFRF